MIFDNRDTEVFMYLVRTFVADKNTYLFLLPTNEFFKVNPNKTLMLCSAKSLKQAITAGEGIV